VEVGYTVLDEVEGVATQRVVFGVRSGARAAGSVIVGPSRGSDALVQSAALDAVTAAGADALYLTRYQVERKGVPFIAETRTAEVVGRALRLEDLGTVAMERADRERVAWEQSTGAASQALSLEPTLAGDREGAGLAQAVERTSQRRQSALIMAAASAGVGVAATAVLHGSDEGLVYTESTTTYGYTVGTYSNPSNPAAAVTGGFAYAGVLAVPVVFQGAVHQAGKAVAIAGHGRSSLALPLLGWVLTLGSWGAGANALVVGYQYDYSQAGNWTLASSALCTT
jgi:hypothetical protein